jgi:predicted MPP superfamily phosphohydrolase
MAVFLLIVSAFPLASIIWWLWADARLRGLDLAPRARRFLRLGLAMFVGLHVLGFVWLFGGRLGGLGVSAPRELLLTTYVWHIVVLPITVVLTILLLLGERVVRVVAPKQRTNSSGAALGISRSPTTSASPALAAEKPPAVLGPALSRRQLLSGAALGAPVFLQGAGVAKASLELNEFRVRDITIKLPDLPRALEGFTIAHVSDTHVGRFTNGRKLDKIADAVNEMKADLVAVTGDLIDYNLADLPAAARMLGRFESRLGTFICEGNHDLFQGREGFEQGLRDAGLRLLQNHVADIPVGDQTVQLAGIIWAQRRNAMFEEQVERVATLVKPGAFPIMLAHHPHAFDAAAAAGFRLTLAGHTHGGQVNIVEGWGPASASYKYLTGLYTQAGLNGLPTACVVSNGAGNWFPLRLAAPAEIIRVVLARA